jgi:hypothetical protein
MTPEALAQMQQQMASSQGQQMIQMMSSMIQSLKGQTPEMNAAGDQATYQMQMTPPPGMLPPGVNVPQRTIPMTFVKEDGKWYIKSNQGGF